MNGDLKADQEVLSAARTTMTSWIQCRRRRKTSNGCSEEGTEADLLKNDKARMF